MAFISIYVYFVCIYFIVIVMWNRFRGVLVGKKGWSLLHDTSMCRVWNNICPEVIKKMPGRVGSFMHITLCLLFLAKVTFGFFFKGDRVLEIWSRLFMSLLIWISSNSRVEYELRSANLKLEIWSRLNMSSLIYVDVIGKVENMSSFD
jgi:hypothetical protein